MKLFLILLLAVSSYAPTITDSRFCGVHATRAILEKFSPREALKADLFGNPANWSTFFRNEVARIQALPTPDLRTAAWQWFLEDYNRIVPPLDRPGFHGKTTGILRCLAAADLPAKDKVEAWDNFVSEIRIHGRLAVLASLANPRVRPDDIPILQEKLEDPREIFLSEGYTDSKGVTIRLGHKGIAVVFATDGTVYLGSSPIGPEAVRLAQQKRQALPDIDLSGYTVGPKEP